jgi:hypothetical protein
MVPQTLAASAFVCTSGACASFTLPNDANTTEIRTTMCAAFREALAEQFSLDLSTVTLTKCEINTPTRLLGAEASALPERALATQTFLCVRTTAAGIPWPTFVTYP